MSDPLPTEAYTALEQAFLRVLRARESGSVHTLRDDGDTRSDRPTTTTDDDAFKASA